MPADWVWARGCIIWHITLETLTSGLIGSALGALLTFIAAAFTLSGALAKEIASGRRSARGSGTRIVVRLPSFAFSGVSEGSNRRSGGRHS